MLVIAGLLVVASEEDGGENEGWSIPQPLRARDPSRAIPRRYRASVRRMRIDLGVSDDALFRK